LEIAALIAILTFAGAIATAVSIKIYHYSFEGQDPDGAYHFTSEPEIIKVGDEITVRQMSVKMTIDPNEVMDVEQQIKDLEEIALLRQQNIRELERVIETSVNGHLDRTFSSNTHLWMDVVKNMGENDPDEIKPRSRSK